ncbi:MAG: 16S rRNA (guanine(527)-N(7))-methyltransferase RsmG [Bacteroidota bacterium]
MDSQIITKYFPALARRQIKQLESLFPLYRDWNQKINVVSRKDIERLYERHVLHSLAIAKFISFSSGTRILDVGTGGGFPGIPLAILFPDCNFHLVDSIAKKIKVVNEVTFSLELQNVTAAHKRMEEVTSSFDFIISRAVAPVSKLHGWTHRLLSKKSKNDIKNGFLLLKGGDLEKELHEYGGSFQEISISDYFTEDFFETKKIIFLPSDN